MKEEVKITERGWAGHFCCSNRCLFRRNTLLEYRDRKIVVSTVGQMKLDSGEIDTIGCNRYYETMAFEVNYADTKYYDIDVDRQIVFHSDWYINKKDSDNEANKMHENVVNEIRKILIDNKIEIEKW